MKRPLVLLSNDDGYRSSGIEAFRRALEPHADVVICAPEVEQSAASHALSLHRPLRLFRHGERVFSVDGTPADCVYVALYGGDDRVLPRKPDLVLSGVNHGRESRRRRVLQRHRRCGARGRAEGDPLDGGVCGAECGLRASRRRSPPAWRSGCTRRRSGPVLLNVNIPAGRDWALRATRLGRRIYRDEVEFRRDPRGREYLWIGGPGASHEAVAGSDTEAFDDGVVGITPLVLDLWHRGAQERAGTACGPAWEPAR